MALSTPQSLHYCLYFHLLGCAH
ncbi:hypothetical protein ACHAWC_005211 [Mediolabrus comicus]